MSHMKSCVFGGTYKDCVKVFACSDLHELDIEELNPSGADIAILAGDIHECPRGKGDKIRKDDEIKEHSNYRPREFIMARNVLGDTACIIDVADNMRAESYRQIQVKGKTMGKVKIVRGDITKFRGDAIVNAANEWMLGGGGIDGAIHRAAGPELLAECRKVPEVRPGVRCPTGEARITPGGRLMAKWVIHTVGPDCSGGMFAEVPELLANCYRNSLSLAAENGIRKIAFPSISTGVFDFPKDEAAKIAVGEVKNFLVEHPDIEVFFFGSPDTMEYYEKEARRQGLR